MVCQSSSRSEVTGSALGANGFFNVEVAIAGLLADPSRASLELPASLTGEERKLAKQVAHQYNDIKCESFGLGKDRRMHLFKCNSSKADMSDASPPMLNDCVSVKNTFIDDWIDSEITSTNERNVQSMPHNMFARCLFSERSAHAVPARESNEAEALTAKATTSTSEKRDFRWSDQDCECLVEDQLFALGAEVVIEGLVKAPSFNGACGVVKSWDEQSGRYNVMLASSMAGGQRWAKLKAENLRSAPQHASPSKL